MQERRNSIANALELRLSWTNGLVQERHNSIANALELRLSWTNPLIHNKLNLPHTYRQSPASSSPREGQPSHHCIPEQRKLSSPGQQTRNIPIRMKSHTAVQKNKRSENDNTPEPIDQRMDSPLMGQHVGSCNTFASTHYFANAFGISCSPRTRPYCKSKFEYWVRHCIALTSFSSQVNWPSHSWKSEIWLFEKLTLKIQVQGHG